MPLDDLYDSEAAVQYIYVEGLHCIREAKKCTDLLCPPMKQKELNYSIYRGRKWYITEPYFIFSFLQTPAVTALEFFIPLFIQNFLALNIAS